MPQRVLVSAPYMQEALDHFRGLFDSEGIELVVPPVSERLSEEELIPLVRDVDGAIAGDDQFSERVLAAAPRLKVIAKWGTGIDSIDQQACKRLGIAVRNTPNAFSEPVADSVLGYILCFARQLHGMDRAMRAGSWRKPPGVALRESTLGVIGVGNVGKAVVRRALAFEMRVLGNDTVQLPAAFLDTYNVTMVDKRTLLGESDFVSLNCDLNPSSHHLIDARALVQMRRTAVLVNTSRGPVVDEKALVDALRDGVIAGAALDVFEEEPLPLDSPLLTMGNVLLAPHNANSSPSAWEAVHQSTIRNLLEVLKREAP